jgi:hypothetical protein
MPFITILIIEGMNILLANTLSRHIALKADNIMPKIDKYL